MGSYRRPVPVGSTVDRVGMVSQPQQPQALEDEMRLGKD
jgi:hypothetical protein